MIASIFNKSFTNASGRNSRRRLIELLTSAQDVDVIEGLLSLTFFCDDYDLITRKVIEFSSNKSTPIRGCAIECLGHIARIHKKLDVEMVKPIIINGLNHEDKFIVDKCRGAMDDIVHFLKLKWEFFTRID